MSKFIHSFMYKYNIEGQEDNFYRFVMIEFVGTNY